jgi:hypothetical protein
LIVLSVLGQTAPLSLEELFTTLGKAETTPRSCEPEVWLNCVLLRLGNLPVAYHLKIPVALCFLIDYNNEI